ncbi:LicD family protein [Enterocloster citroniae]|uniref:LicD family protein n=1 Tax=Enterocloster citroniae TaxID=358743 RepID=UPI00189977C9|nr:LicD family protein [Enterocloster citroniae]
MRLHHVAKNAENDLSTMDKGEIEKLHQVLLIILDDMLSVCKDNSLDFALIGGTAIGALRHKGFIPWDDDIDIAMPRADFEMFCDIINSELLEKYSILHPQEKHNFGRVIPKIRLKGTEYRTILEQDLDDCGIFIDIYIIENIFDNPILMYFQGVMCIFLGFILSCTRLYFRKKELEKLTNGMSFKIKGIIGKIFSFATLDQWARWTDYWHSFCKDSDTKRISIPADGKHYFGGIQLRKDFCNFYECVFEGRKCYLPGNYDSYLRGYYNDYMQIPPVEKRQRNQYIAYDLGKYKQ